MNDVCFEQKNCMHDRAVNATKYKCAVLCVIKIISVPISGAYVVWTSYKLYFNFFTRTISVEIGHASRRILVYQNFWRYGKIYELYIYICIYLST